MSTPDVSTEILESLGMEEDDLIRWVLGKTYIVDFGFVVGVTGSPATKVNVKHAAHLIVVGQEQGDTITNDVEVLWPGGAAFSASFPIAAGDPVLLVALKDDVSVARTTPSKADTPLHYTQETLKAIPLGKYNAGAGFLINVDSSHLLQIKNAAASLYTVLNNLMSAINTFSNLTSQGVLTAGSATSASLATALNGLLATMNASIVSVTTALGQIMKA
jgi:hypothetical protein